MTDVETITMRLSDLEVSHVPLVDGDQEFHVPCDPRTMYLVEVLFDGVVQLRRAFWNKGAALARSKELEASVLRMLPQASRRPPLRVVR